MLLFFGEWIWVLFNRLALLKYSQKIFITIIIAKKHNLEIMFQEWESARFVIEHAVFNNEHFSELYRTLCVTNLFNVCSDDTMWTPSIMKLNMESQILNSWCSKTWHFCCSVCNCRGSNQHPSPHPNSLNRDKGHLDLPPVNQSILSHDQSYTIMKAMWHPNQDQEHLQFEKDPEVSCRKWT